MWGAALSLRDKQMTQRNLGEGVPVICVIQMRALLHATEPWVRCACHQCDADVRAFA